MNPSAENRLKKIISDNKSGSTEILQKLINWSKDYRNEEKTLLEMIDASNKNLKTFSAVQSFTKNLKAIIKKDDKRKFFDFLDEQTEHIAKRYSDLFKNSLPYLINCKRIVTISNSKTVMEILKRLNEQKNIFVTIGESRPQLEGRIMAKELLKHKVKVEIVPDTYLPNVIEKADAALTGADSVLSNGDVVNKTGSRSLAIGSKYFRKPFYVLAAKDKISFNKKYSPEKRNENEIWNYDHKFLTKANYYFEVVEKKLITKIIFD